MSSVKPTLASLAVMLATVPALPGIAFADQEKPREAVIMVSGEGESAIAPDMAILSLAVVREAETAADAMKESNTAMTAVLDALKGEGIADKDIQTSDFSVNPRYSQEKNSDGGYQSPKIDGYQVSNRLTVKVRDLKKLGAILDKSVTLGVNESGNVQFTNDDPKEAVTAARKQAVDEAIAKARALTEAAGVKLGRIVEMSENFARPMPQPAYRMAMAKEASDAVPIAGGENSYSVTVNITYAIDQ